jgi:CheY-like chemotaxis protein
MNIGSVILVVEPSDADFESLQRGFGQAGIRNEVLRFSDGEEVLAFLRGKFSDDSKSLSEYLILSELDLPSMDGLKLLKRLKGDTVLKRIPVIVISHKDDSATVDECHRVGCSVYIVKPAETGEFESAIRKVGLFLSVVEMPLAGETD